MSFDSYVTPAYNPTVSGFNNRLVGFIRMTTCTEVEIKAILRAYRIRRFQGVRAEIARRLVAVEHAITYGLTVTEALARLEFALLRPRRSIIMGVMH